MRRVLALAWLLLAGLALPVRAIVIDGGNGTQNFSAPADDPGFANVASTGVYLGDYGGSYWAITASHVGAGNLTLGGITYNYVAGSAVQVLNGNSTTTDLTLFRLASDPGLPTLALATSNPLANDIVRFVTDGSKENAFTRWSVNTATNPDTWTVVGSGDNASGYTETGGTGMRWGDAVVAGTATINLSGSTATFYTEFVPVAGSSQGAANDSGGAAFFKAGGIWYLAGIMSAVGTFDGQPANTAVFGDITYISSIPNYYSFITATAIPEPATATLFVGLVVLGLAGIRRRRI
jgi:hypothetical protein